MNKKIDKDTLKALQEILKEDVMYYPLKFERDVNLARIYLKEALEKIKRIENDSENSSIIRLERVQLDFEEYGKLKKTKTNYSDKFEVKKEKAKGIIQAYLDDKLNRNNM